MGGGGGGGGGGGSLLTTGVGGMAVLFVTGCVVGVEVVCVTFVVGLGLVARLIESSLAALAIATANNAESIVAAHTLLYHSTSPPKDICKR